MADAAESRAEGARVSRETATGLLSALAAFLIWGFAPIYFKALDGIGAVEIIAHRIVWTVVLLVALLVALGRGRDVIAAAALIRRPRQFGVYLLTTLLVSANWLIFIWAILDEHLLQVSLGYYINPLVNVVLGMLFLAERLSRRQAAAVGLAAIGVAIQVAAVGTFPWVALALAFSFGLYALVRKMAGIDPMVGLLVETCLLAPASLAYLVWLAATGEGAFGTGGAISLLLVLSGPITGAPLVLYMVGALRLKLGTIGLMQYLSPSLHFAIAVLLFGEPFGAGHLLTFAFIWAALALFSWDAVATFRRTRAAVHGA